MSPIAALSKAFTAQFAIFVVLATCVADFGMKPRRPRLQAQTVQVRSAICKRATLEELTEPKRVTCNLGWMAAG